jgi:flagellar capping protein FliD
MRDNQKRLNVYVPEDLYTQIVQPGRTVTEVVIQALEAFLTDAPGQSQTESNELKAIQEARIQELQNHNELLKKELEIILGSDKNTSSEEGKSNEELVMSLNRRIESLEDQLKTKDNQIGKLTENMQAQSVHIQTLINQKAIEAPGAKKPWWRFW